MLVVLDQFQEFSGAYGRQVGDEMLLELARLLQEFSDRGDVIMRLGADELYLFRHVVLETYHPLRMRGKSESGLPGRIREVRHDREFPRHRRA